MPLTADPKYPPEALALFQSFSACAEKHDLNHVLDAALQVVVCSIVAIAKSRKLSEDQIAQCVASLANQVLDSVHVDITGAVPANAETISMKGN